jgi:hypothetical protein
MSIECGFCERDLRGPHAIDCIVAHPYNLHGLQFTDWQDSTQVKPEKSGIYEVFALVDWKNRPLTPPAEGSGIYSTFDVWWGRQNVMPVFDLEKSCEQRLWWRGISEASFKALTKTLRGGNWRISYDPTKYGRGKPWEAYYGGKSMPVSHDEDLVPFRCLEEAVDWLLKKGANKATITKALRERLNDARTTAR